MTKTTLSRRNFFKVAGAAAGALALSQAYGTIGQTTNVQAAPMDEVKQNKTTTDILVIGGGMAAAFAAVAAREQGLNVTLIDKGTVGRSGATPWANGYNVFDSASEDKDEWIRSASMASDYLNNHDWTEQFLDDSAERWADLENWGVLANDVRHPSLKLRDKLVEENVTLIERTMVTSLLQDDDGRVIGAMGFHADSEESVVVLAKATVMCAGAGGFKAPGFPIHNLTSDGDAMAYRAGAFISGKEWVDFHWTNLEAPASCWKQWGNMWVQGLGSISGVFSRGMTLDSAYTAHEGEATVTEGAASTSGMGAPPEGEAPADGEMPSGPPPGGDNGDRPSGPPPDGEGGSAPGQSSGIQVLGAATGLGIHKAEGIWPIGLDGACNVPGLYAAGDALASMVCGASYCGLGVSLSGSAVQGRVAGLGASEYAKGVAAPAMAEDALSELQTAMFAPRERETGFTPAWATQVLQNAMFPYYVLMVKQEDRMHAALSTIMFIQEHLVPNLIAGDAHELRLAHEVANMALNAEMKLRSALFRTESRGTHYREDYPARDDDNWLAWTLISQGADGSMELTKEPIPDAWKPDPSVDYEERYPTRFPGELEYLGLA